MEVILVDIAIGAGAEVIQETVLTVLIRETENEVLIGKECRLRASFASFIEFRMSLDVTCTKMHEKAYV